MKNKASSPLQIGSTPPNFHFGYDGQKCDLYNFIEDSYGLVVSFPKGDCIDLSSLSSLVDDYHKRNTKIIGITSETEDILEKKLQTMEDYSMPVHFPIICDEKLHVLSHYGLVGEDNQVIKGAYLVRDRKICGLFLSPLKFNRDFKIFLQIIDSMSPEEINDTCCKTEYIAPEKVQRKISDLERNEVDESEHVEDNNHLRVENNQIDEEYQPKKTASNYIHPKEKFLSKYINQENQMHERVRTVTVAQKGEVNFNEEEINEFTKILQHVPMHKTLNYEKESLTFEGKMAVDTFVSRLNLPSRSHALNILDFLLYKQMIIPVYSTIFGNKHFKDDKTLYMCLETTEDKDLSLPQKNWSNLFNIEEEGQIKVTPFASLLKVKVIKVKHLQDKQAKFLSGKNYHYEFMLGKDIIHSRTRKASHFLQSDDPICITFPVFYSRQILNISLVENKVIANYYHRFESSIPLSQVSQRFEKFCVPLIDKDTLQQVGMIKLFLQQTFLHDTFDDGTHFSPWSFPEGLYSPTPIDLAKKTVEKLENKRFRRGSIKFGEPNHRCCVDFIINEESTEDIKLEGWFKYGVGCASSGRFVELFLQEPDSYIHTGKWTSYGVSETVKGGRVEFMVPRDAVSGRTRVMMVMLSDFTFARGCIWVLKKNTEAIIFDLDGTVSTHDLELIKTLIGEPLNIHYDGEERNGARVCANHWWALGYLPIYLSGRAGSYYELTLRWLENHNFPPGLVGHTLDSIPTLPIYRVLGSDRLGVGTFKKSYLNKLRDKYGIQFKAAYGNTSTDVKVYKKLGLKKEQIFMLLGGGIGFHHGTKDYIEVGKDFLSQWPFMDNIPSPENKIPTKSIAW